MHDLQMFSDLLLVVVASRFSCDVVSFGAQQLKPFCDALKKRESMEPLDQSFREEIARSFFSYCKSQVGQPADERSQAMKSYLFGEQHTVDQDGNAKGRKRQLPSSSSTVQKQIDHEGAHVDATAAVKKQIEGDGAAEAEEAADGGVTNADATETGEVEHQQIKKQKLHKYTDADIQSHSLYLAMQDAHRDVVKKNAELQTQCANGLMQIETMKANEERDNFRRRVIKEKERLSNAKGHPFGIMSSPSICSHPSDADPLSEEHRR